MNSYPLNDVKCRGCGRGMTLQRARGQKDDGVTRTYRSLLEGDLNKPRQVILPLNATGDGYSLAGLLCARCAASEGPQEAE